MNHRISLITTKYFANKEGQDEKSISIVRPSSAENAKAGIYFCQRFGLYATEKKYKETFDDDHEAVAAIMHLPEFENFRCSLIKIFKYSSIKEAVFSDEPELFIYYKQSTREHLYQVAVNSLTKNITKSSTPMEVAEEIRIFIEDHFNYGDLFDYEVVTEYMNEYFYSLR